MYNKLVKLFPSYLILLIVLVCILGGTGDTAIAAVNSILIQEYNTSTSSQTQQIQFNFIVKNTGTNTLNMSDIKVRYYFTMDGTAGLNFSCYYSDIGSTNVFGNFYTCSGVNADHYLEMTFASGITISPGSSKIVIVGIYKSDWSNFTQTNDYSFNSSAMNYVDWNKMAGYVFDTLVWGTSANSSYTSTPTSTPTKTPTATPTKTPTSINTPTPMPSGVLKVEYHDYVQQNPYNAIIPDFRLTNVGSGTVNLSTVKLRYYYTIDSEASQNFVCDYFVAGTSYVTGTCVKLSTPCTNSDYYLEVGFTSGAGSLGAGASVEIGTRIYKTDGSNYNKTNDYSYSSTSSYVEWNYVTAYINGALVWGIPPSIVTLIPTKTPTHTPTQTPTQTYTPTPTLKPTPTPGNGTGLTGEYYDNADFTNFILRRTDATVNFNWGAGSPNVSVGADTFSVRWFGLVQPLYSETYTFYTTSDDGIRLWINGQLVINNWTDHLATENSGTINLIAGQKYDIRMDFYENGVDATATLSWSSASQIKQIIPQTQLYVVDYTQGAEGLNDAQAQIWITPTITSTGVVLYYRINSGTQQNILMVNNSGTWESVISGLGDRDVVDYYFIYEKSGSQYATPLYTYNHIASTGTGLLGEYFDNMDLTNSKLTRIDSTVNFNWDTGTPDASIGADTFSVRWLGQVEPRYSEVYTFYTNSDDGVRLWINNQLLIDNWTDHSAALDNGSISLQAGRKYDIRMEYYENGTYAVAALSWSSASQTMQVIPQTQLYPVDYSQGMDYVDETHARTWFKPVTPSTGVAVHYKINSGGQTDIAMTDNGGTWQYIAGSLNNLDVVSYCFTYERSESQYTTSWFSYTHYVFNGTGLTGQYYDNIDFTGYKLSRTDSTINFNWGINSPDLSMGTDTFSIKWMGKVQPLYSENYIFYVSSDEGVRLWVNGLLLIDKWVGQLQTEWSGSISLIKGHKYDIRLEYFENAGPASAVLSWSSESQSKQVIPQNNLYISDYIERADYVGETLAKLWITPVTQSTGVTVHYKINSGIQRNYPMTENSGNWEYIVNGLSNLNTVSYYFTYEKSGLQYDTPWFTYIHVVCNGTGLTGDYYDNIDFIGHMLSRIDPTVDFDWGTGPPDVSMGSDTYSVMWSGFVQPRFSETYTFYTYTDDGVRLTIDGQVLIDRFTSTIPAEYSNTVTLAAGQKYSIKIEFYKNTGSGLAGLSWSSPSQEKQVIQQENLYPVIRVFYSIQHKVLTGSQNNFVIGDILPMSLKFKIQKAIENPVIGIDLNIKKADGSSSGFILKEIKTDGILDKKAVSIYKNGVSISFLNFSLAIDTSEGKNMLKVSITGSFANEDVLEIKYRTKVSAKNTVFNYGIQKYLNDNGLNNVDLNVYYEVSQWIEDGELIILPYTMDSTDDANEKSNFFAGIKVEDPSILD